MKLWAICIGRAEDPNRYVAYHPDFPTWNAKEQTPPLAVTDDYQRARTMRKQTLKSSGHKSVYIVSFDDILIR